MRLWLLLLLLILLIFIFNVTKRRYIYSNNNVLCLLRADHSSRGVLPRVVSLSMIVQSRQRGSPGPSGSVGPQNKMTFMPVRADFLLTLFPLVFVARGSQVR